MLELPEAHVLANQLKTTLAGKTIVSAQANAHPHGFAWYSGDPAHYGMLLDGRKITDAVSYGGRTEICAEDMRLSFMDGINARYLAEGAKHPAKHQLLLEFDSGDALYCTIQMYGGIFAFPQGKADDEYERAAKEKPSPLSSEFDEEYFNSFLSENKAMSLSAKAFLATKQRIPGLGNGVLQDILFNANIHPKRKLETFDDGDMGRLFASVKTTLAKMCEFGGRDTEKDFFGNKGGYKTILSKNTLPHPCRICGSGIVRQAYLGGNIYFCPSCQPL